MYGTHSERSRFGSVPFACLKLYDKNALFAMMGGKMYTQWKKIKNKKYAMRGFFEDAIRGVIECCHILSNIKSNRKHPYILIFLV